MRTKSLVASLLVLVAGCASSKNTMYPDITVVGAAELLAADSEVVVLDIRTPEEFAQGRIPGAVQVDAKAADFAERLRGLDRSKTYVMH